MSTLRRPRANPKYRTASTPATRATRLAKLSRAAAQIRAREAPMIRIARLQAPSLRTDRHTFDALPVGGRLFNATSDSAVAVSATGYITTNASALVINQVPQNTTSNGRLGRRIAMTGVQIAGNVAVTVGGHSAQPVRMCLVYFPSMDRSVTAMPPHNVIWQAQDPRALRVLTDNTDFRVLKQWTWNMGGVLATPACGLEQYYFNEVVPLNNLETVWSTANTDGTFNDMDKGALCIYMHGGALSTTANPITILLNTRLYFHE